MHVLITADTIGGVWTYTRELVCGLARQGMQVTLVSFGQLPSSDQIEWLEGLKNVDYRPTAFKLEWMRECEEDLAASAEYLRALVAEVKPDVLHLGQYCYGALECETPRIVVAHSDVVSWWVAVHGTEPEDNAWIRGYRKAVARGLHGVSMVVAPSRWMLDAIREHYFVPRYATVIHNGRTPSEFEPYVSKESFALAAGRVWDAGKNLSLLGRIEPPLPLYVAGASLNPNDKMRSWWNGRIENTRLKFLGPQTGKQMRMLYAHAQIFVVPSRYEPFGLAPVEAALSRCALVVSDIPSLRELWEDAALYFTNNDESSLRQALEKLHSQPELRARYGKMAYLHALHHFAAQRMVENYLRLYRTLAKRGALAA